MAYEKKGPEGESLKGTLHKPKTWGQTEVGILPGFRLSAGGMFGNRTRLPRHAGQPNHLLP